jgi:transposase
MMRDSFLGCIDYSLHNSWNYDKGSASSPHPDELEYRAKPSALLGFDTIESFCGNTRHHQETSRKDIPRRNQRFRGLPGSGEARLLADCRKKWSFSLKRIAGEFWLTDREWSAMEPYLPKNQPGARRVDDRRVISGILHVLKTGCRWRDCPAVYGPPTTIYNRYSRWLRRGLWQHLYRILGEVSPGEVQIIDSAMVKAHRSPHIEKSRAAR